MPLVPPKEGLDLDAVRTDRCEAFEKGCSEMTEMKTIVETKRLILRRYCKEDLQDLYEYLSDETVVRFEPYKPMDMNAVKDDLDRRISTDEMVAVELKSHHKLIGNVFLGNETVMHWNWDMFLTGSFGDKGMRQKAVLH